MDERNKVTPLFPDKDGQGTEGGQIPQSRPMSQDWKQAFQHLIQSALGKYTLETYLESLGEFTDSEIRTQVKHGLIYHGGEVSFSADPGTADISATVCLQFQDRTGQWKQRKAERSLCKSMFTQETVQRLEEAEELSFEISAPEEE